MLRQRLIWLVCFVTLALLVGCQQAATPAAPAPTQAATAAAPAVPAPTQVAAAKTPKQGGVLRVGIEGEPAATDPHDNQSTTTLYMTMQIFEPLMNLDGENNTRPGLADSWQLSPDAKQLTLKLRQGIKFHNGNEMTAKDVVASLKRMEKRHSRIAADLKGVTYETPDNYTVIMTMPIAYAAMPNVLAWPAAGIMPAAIAEKYMEGRPAESDIIGTGPLQFVEWVKGKHVKLKKFADYKPRPEANSWFAGGKQVYVDEVLLVIVPEVASRLAALQAGDLDAALNLPLDQYESLKASTTVVPQLLKNSERLYGYFNYYRPPFNNVLARKAIQVGVDLEPIMQGAVGNPAFYSLSPSIFPEGSFWYTTENKGLWNKKDIAQAKELLKQSGYDGKPIKILASRDQDVFYRATLVYVEQLKAMGFNVDLELMEWPKMVSIIGDRKFDAWDIFVSNMGLRIDPVDVKIHYHDGSSVFWQYKNPNTTKLLDQITSESDPAKRKALWEQVQALHYEDAAYIYFGWRSQLQAHRSYVQGFQDKYFPVFHNTWLDK